MNEQWYGLAPSGGEVMIGHAELMSWASREEMQFQVGWSHHINLRGTRLVRGPQKITTAREQGWNDLADKLESFGIKDAA